MGYINCDAYALLSPFISELQNLVYQLNEQKFHLKLIDTSTAAEKS